MINASDVVSVRVDMSLTQLSLVSWVQFGHDLGVGWFGVQALILPGFSGHRAPPCGGIQVSISHDDSTNLLLKFFHRV